MKSLKDFKKNKVEIKSIYGGKVWKTSNPGNEGCGPRGLDMYDDQTGYCYDQLGHRTC